MRSYFDTANRKKLEKKLFSSRNPLSLNEVLYPLLNAVLHDCFLNHTGVKSWFLLSENERSTHANYRRHSGFFSKDEKAYVRPNANIYAEKSQARDV